MAAPTRDSAQTRANILDAARREFAMSGFAGARVDEIAKKAGCDKRLIYRYFEDKSGLFGAVMHSALSHKREALGPMSGCLAETFARIFPTLGGDEANAEWLRILLWESLEGEVVALDERRAETRKRCAEVRMLQEHGGISAELEPEYVQLVLVSIALFPWLLQQFPLLSVGKCVSDPSFQKRYIHTVKHLFAHGLDSTCAAAEKPGHRRGAEKKSAPRAPRKA